jgi:hypothetical protein
MARQELQSDGTKMPSPLHLVPPEFAAIGQKSFEGLANAQSELLGKIQKANQDWFERMQLEASEASKLASRLTTARSLPETTAACQEWASRRIEIAAEYSKRLLDNGQQFVETGARLFSNGYLSKSRQDSTGRGEG